MWLNPIFRCDATALPRSRTCRNLSCCRLVVETRSNQHLSCRQIGLGPARRTLRKTLNNKITAMFQAHKINWSTIESTKIYGKICRGICVMAVVFICWHHLVHRDWWSRRHLVGILVDATPSSQLLRMFWLYISYVDEANNNYCIETLWLHVQTGTCMCTEMIETFPSWILMH